MILPSRRAPSFCTGARYDSVRASRQPDFAAPLGRSLAIQKMTDWGQVLLMVGADGVQVRNSFQATTCRGHTPLIDVTPICWHQAINSPTTCG